MYALREFPLAGATSLTAARQAALDAATGDERPRLSQPTDRAMFDQAKRARLAHHTCASYSVRVSL